MVRVDAHGGDIGNKVLSQPSQVLYMGMKKVNTVFYRRENSLMPGML